MQFMMSEQQFCCSQVWHSAHPAQARASGDSVHELPLLPLLLAAAPQMGVIPPPPLPLPLDELLELELPEPLELELLDVPSAPEELALLPLDPPLLVPEPPLLDEPFALPEPLLFPLPPLLPELLLPLLPFSEPPEEPLEPLLPPFPDELPPPLPPSGPPPSKVSPA
jgi:hypothetical protein